MYASWKLKIHERNYTTHGLELGAVVFTLKIWKHVLVTSSKAWSACVDHLRSWWKIYFAVLVDIAEGIGNTAKHAYDLSSSNGRTKSPVLWAEIGEIRSIGPELVQETTNKVILIKEKLKAARDCQKSYVGNRRKHLELKLEYWTDANMHVPLEEIKVHKTLHFVEEPVEIIDREKEVIEIESFKSSAQHSVNDFVVINIPEEDVEPKQIILDPYDQPMWESAKTVAPTPNYAIIQLDIDDNFIINSTHLNMIRENKFDGYLRADPHDHIREFLAICNMFRYGETHSEAVKLLIFPFSLCDEAKTWFNELNEESITSWEQMRRSFINRFFPPSLFNRLLLKIRNFSQLVCESLIDAWLRLKNMLQKCHGHGLTKGTIIQIFYHGIDEPTQGILDITAGGIFLYKTPNQAFQFLDDKVLFEHDWPIKSKNDHHQKYVSLTDGSDSKTDNSRFMEKLKAMDSQIISLKEELQYMRKKYNELREENASKNHLNEDSPPPIIVNNKIKKDKPNKTSKRAIMW
ncbi:reverse transcriptase domain-containing protein [Tanacetum coccineum]